MSPGRHDLSYVSLGCTFSFVSFFRSLSRSPLSFGVLSAGPPFFYALLPVCEGDSVAPEGWLQPRLSFSVCRRLFGVFCLGCVCVCGGRMAGCATGRCGSVWRLLADDDRRRLAVQLVALPLPLLRSLQRGGWPLGARLKRAFRSEGVHS